MKCIQTFTNKNICIMIARPNNKGTKKAQFFFRIRLFQCPYFTRFLRVLTFCLEASKIVILKENGVVKIEETR